MLTTNEVARVYDTLMSIPAMNERVKIDLRVSRKNVLLLYNVIKRGLLPADAGPVSDLFHNIPMDSVAELTAIAEDFLQKAGLTELSKKLNGLGSD